MHRPVPEKPSVWVWLRKFGLYLAAAAAILLVWIVLWPEPDLHGERSVGGPLWITGFILAVVFLYWRFSPKRKTPGKYPTTDSYT